MNRLRNGESSATVQSAVYSPARAAIEMIRRPFEAKKAQHGCQRRQPDSPLPEPGGVQPGFVELQPHRQQVRDALMQARDEESAYGRVGHTLIWGSGIDPVYSQNSLVTVMVDQQLTH